MKQVPGIINSSSFSALVQYSHDRLPSYDLVIYISTTTGDTKQPVEPPPTDSNHSCVLKQAPPFARPSFNHPSIFARPSFVLRSIFRSTFARPSSVQPSLGLTFNLRYELCSTFVRLPVNVHPTFDQPSVQPPSDLPSIFLRPPLDQPKPNPSRSEQPKRRAYRVTYKPPGSNPTAGPFCGRIAGP